MYDSVWQGGGEGTAKHGRRPAVMPNSWGIPQLSANQLFSVATGLLPCFAIPLPPPFNVEPMGLDRQPTLPGLHLEGKVTPLLAYWDSAGGTSSTIRGLGCKRTNSHQKRAMNCTLWSKIIRRGTQCRWYTCVMNSLASLWEDGTPLYGTKWACLEKSLIIVQITV